MVFLSLVLAGVALWLALGLRRRVVTLEVELARMRKEAVEAPQSDAVPPQSDPMPSALPHRKPAGRPERPTPERAAAPVPPGGVWSGTASGGAGAVTGAPTDALTRASLWLRDNWIYPVAAAALIMAGIFLIQYSVERGLLTPLARIVLALSLGLALAAGGEALRRMPLAGAILPAMLAGSGMVVMMAAVLGALHLYVMIGPAVALVGLALLALGTIALGWLHGPFLAALGLVAGTAAPFLLGGGGPPPAAMFGYFALLALIGLGIDAARRWGWVSWLALAGPLAAMVLWRLAGGDALTLAMALLVVAGAAMTLPFGRVAPVVAGAGALSRAAPAQGVRASFTATGIAAGALALMVPEISGAVALTLLAGLVAIWCRHAPALADQLLLPLLAMPLWVFWQDFAPGAVLRAFAAPLPPESAMPLQASLVLVLAALAGAALLWRGERDAPGRHAPWTLAGLALPGAVLVTLEIFWQPAQVIGAWPWALHAMALAGAATALALRYAKLDAGQGPRLGAAAVAAFALVALGMTLLIGQAALTLALAVLMVAAAAMDRRFDIPALSVFQAAAAFALMWRLVIDPGLSWHLAWSVHPGFANPVELFLSLGATLAAPVLALWLSRNLAQDSLRRHAGLTLETMLVAATGISAAILILRLLPDHVGPHALLGLMVTVLMLLAWVQLRRAALPPLPWLRRGLARALGGAGAFLMLLALVPVSPVFGDGWLRGEVAGWPLFNDLVPAYLLPALVLLLMGRHALLRAAGWALAAVWAGKTIRHLWQGAEMALARGIEPGELYAYTFALLLAGAMLVGRAILTARPDLRRLGLVLVGVAAAKAFLIDAAGLDGLLRIGAFLGLGLSLAALAWINGWAVQREGRAAQQDPDIR